MATNREERMQQRLRGAGRHQVEDISFGFVLDVGDEDDSAPAEDAAQAVPDPVSQAADEPTPRATRSTPNSSAKRRRLDTEEVGGSAVQTAAVLEVAEATAVAAPAWTTRATAKRSRAGRNLYDFGDHTSVENEPVAATRRPRRPPSPPADGANELENLPSPARPISRDAAHRPSVPFISEEVGESPADAPGSGQRRRVIASSAAASSSRLLQRAVQEPGEDDDDEDDDDDPVQNSSPLVRKSKQSRTARPTSTAPASRPTRAGARRSVRLSGDSIENEQPDELSPEASKQPLASPEERPARRRGRPVRPSAKAVSTAEDAGNEGGPEDEQEAEEIDNTEAAARLGGKRSRRSPAAGSPELDTQVVEEEEPPPPKRPRRRARKSPAQQKQPRQQKRKDKPVSKKRGGVELEAESEEVGKKNSIPIIVQRFTQGAKDDEDEDDGGEEGDRPEPDMMTYANRGGVNAVDVLRQMCEEIMNHAIGSLKDKEREVEDRAEKRDIRVRLRALDAFQEELSTRLLEHTIALDALHTMKKRYRVVQKEKLGLREEILQIRAEREQVALRMDAARLKHERESKKALHQICLSSTMHDVDLAVEKGQAAPELPAAERKTADLANLELLISRVADQASTRSAVGGTLRQIREFNSFLERAATALATR